MKKRLAALAVLAAVLLPAAAAEAHGNPPGTTCTGYRYGKGGGKTCIRWKVTP